MFDLPYETHGWLTEPGNQHLRKILIQRFLNFIKQIKKSGKYIVKLLFNTIKLSVRSTTGHNLRAIMMETNKVNIDRLDDIRGGDIEYHPVKNDDRWKVSVIKECIDVKFGRLDVDGFSADELEEICYYLCIS